MPKKGDERIRMAMARAKKLEQQEISTKEELAEKYEKDMAAAGAALKLLKKAWFVSKIPSKVKRKKKSKKKTKKKAVKKRSIKKPKAKRKPAPKKKKAKRPVRKKTAKRKVSRRKK